MTSGAETLAKAWEAAKLSGDADLVESAGNAAVEYSLMLERGFRRLEESLEKCRKGVDATTARW